MQVPAGTLAIGTSVRKCSAQDASGDAHPHAVSTQTQRDPIAKEAQFASDEQVDSCSIARPAQPAIPIATTIATTLNMSVGLQLRYRHSAAKVVSAVGPVGKVKKSTFLRRERGSPLTLLHDGITV